VKTLDAKKQAKIQQALAEGQRRIAEYQAAGQTPGSKSASRLERVSTVGQGPTSTQPRQGAALDEALRLAEDVASHITPGRRREEPSPVLAKRRTEPAPVVPGAPAAPARTENRMQATARAYWKGRRAAPEADTSGSKLGFSYAAKAYWATQRATA
jgi:hypothetical protein